MVVLRGLLYEGLGTSREEAAIGSLKSPVKERSIMEKPFRARLFAVLIPGAIAGLMAAMPAYAWNRAPIMPACTEPPVAKRIIEDFNWAERNTWRRGFSMEKLTRMHEHRTEQWRNSPVLRRYCMATAHMSDGQRRNVYYLIEDRGGFAGQTWEVTHCVSGLDDWRNHDGHCRTMR